MSADDSQPWTTSRCNRLLRPVSSKLAKLRKELERPRSSGGEPRHVSSAFATKGSPQKTTNFTRPALKPRGFDKARDPDWRPGAKPGASKKTYGGRGGRKAADPRRSSSDAAVGSQPGEIAFTPFITRMGSHLHSSPQLHNSPLKKYGKNRGPLLVGFEQLHSAKQLPVDLRKLVQGLSEAYANLLQATTTGSEKRWTGTRSLMGACLRKMPTYIELEEHFAELDKLEEEEEAEGRDVASEIYEHLEVQFEQRCGRGWRPFKQVVRAHGTSLMCSAISSAILGLESLSLLVMHCLNVSAWDEAERLLLAYSPLIEPLSFPINTKADLFDSQKQPYFSIYKNFVDRTERYHLIYDLLEHLVALELLPLEWLATECMRPIWDRLVRTITVNDHRTLKNVLCFMETATLASLGLPDERLLEDEVAGSVSRRFVPSSRADLRLALNTTFSSLLTVLCSIALVNNSCPDTNGVAMAQRVTRALDATIVALSIRNDIQSELENLNADTEDVQNFSQRAVWVNFSSFLVHLNSCSTDGTMISMNVPTIIGLCNHVSAQYSPRNVNFALVLGGLPAFISSIARGAGRISSDDGFDQLQRLVAALTTTSGCQLPHKLWTLKRLALESAMEFAHGTGNPEHMAYTREIERKMRTQGRLVIVHSPEKNASPIASGGFKWEEGIGEWVACTPFIKQNVNRVSQKNLRALQLLPTPEQSGDERSDASEIDEQLLNINDNSTWGTTAFDLDDDDDDTAPQSSPIKKAPRTSFSFLGKRTRASSPMVVIPGKRMHMTPPSDTPLAIVYPEHSQDTQGSLRRSRRSRRDVQALTARLRTQRSRTSLDSGLRDVPRPTYAEHDPEHDIDAFSSDSSDDEHASTTHPQSATSRSRQLRQCSPPVTRSRPVRVKPDGDDAAEPDELGRTPVRCQSGVNRFSGRMHGARGRVRRRVGALVVHDSDDDSEDELSFQ